MRPLQCYSGLTRIPLLVLGALLVCSSPGYATSPEDILAMKQALGHTNRFNKFLDLWARADNISGLSHQPVFRFFNVTIFAPHDRGFDTVSDINYQNPRCYDPSQGPDGCSFPIVAFHIVKQKLRIRDIIHAPENTLWDTVEGSSIEKFESRGKGLPFFIAPQFGIDIFGANVLSPSSVVQPNVYKSHNITVHAVDLPLPCPVIYPNGWVH